MSKNTLRPVSVVTASAGTGKTYDLTSRIKDAIANGGDPEKVLASTFTVKAAEELRERARERLIGDGRGAEAIRLLGARIGTINGVSGGLVKEFAFGLGLSPIVDVLDEHASKRIFLIAADEAIGARADELGELSRRFGYDTMRQRRDWRDDVNKIVELARANNVDEGALVNCAERSIAGFRAITPRPLPGETAATLDDALRRAVSALTRRDPATFGAGKKVAKKTTDELEILRDFETSGRIEDQPWQKWAKLTKLDVAVPDRDAFAEVIAAAGAFARHPRLLGQVETYIRGVFACAAEAMAAYERYKRTWGLVDFVDQDRLALALLGREDVRVQLSERVQSVFVDEFQDTSPLQLAVFIELSQIAESSVWVGDPKQSIYGFRGTDPELIVRVAQDVRAATGGDDATLRKNYRSRPALVAFFNDAFGRTFEMAGLPSRAVRIDEVDRNDLPAQSTPLAVWRLSGRTNAQRYDAIAAGVAAAIASSGDWVVADRGAARALGPGDIAVLCRNNAPCTAVAAAIARTGLKVAIERNDLFGTPEARLALAALRWCADMRDSVALAELAHLLHEGETQPAWFEASLAGDPIDRIAPLVPIAENLRAVAAGGVHMTPLEFFDAVLVRGGVARSVLRWGWPDDRLLNLEQLRSLVAAYQDERKRDRAPTTVTDLCAWLADQEAQRPASRSADAVTVATYHGSKGLEWPFVVLTDLDDEAKASAFGVRVASDKSWSEVDWRNPLDGRWVRFWPWPLGAQRDNVTLDASAANAPEGRTAAQNERAERIRLLYVGATRARDYLVLAVPPSASGLPWLDELRAEDGAPAIAVPAASANSMIVNGKDHPVRVFEFAALPAMSFATLPSVYASPTVEIPSFLPLAIRPSAEATAEDARIVEEVNLGARLPFSGSPDMNDVGEVLHRFLAADDPTWDEARRNALAAGLLDAWGVTGFDPRDVASMGARFRQFVTSRWPGATLRREAPINWRVGGRTLAGRLDLVVEANSEIVVFDHKSFPGGRAQWFDQARKYAGQLRSYGDAVRAATSGAKPVRLALHLPIGGEILFVE